MWKIIWSPLIPPSKSFLLWQVHQNRVPTDEKRLLHHLNLLLLFGSCNETSSHLFFDCYFARQIWAWAGSKINVNFNLLYAKSVLGTLLHSWSKQAKDVVLSLIINSLGAIWFCGKQLRFNNKMVPFQTTTLISSFVTFFGSCSKGCFKNNISKFSLLKAFLVYIHPWKALQVVSVRAIKWANPNQFSLGRCALGPKWPTRSNGPHS